MASSRPIQIQISDIVQWFDRKEMVVNDTFQRNAVWAPTAKTYLIDTILSQLPIPKIYIRTRINPRTQTSIREIIDGQQRVRAIYEFAKNDLKLTSKSNEFSGLKYSDLDEEQQEEFLGYTITAEQLLNASDDDVIDIFARINSYTVALNAAEMRHARFQTNLKFAVRETSRKYRAFVEDYNIFTTRQRFRMADDAFFAELFQLVLEGVKDGGAKNIDRFYSRMDDDVFTASIQNKVQKQIATVIDFFSEHIEEVLTGKLSKHYQLLILAAAYLHLRYGILSGDLKRMPVRKKIASSEVVIRRLATLNRVLETEDEENLSQRNLDFLEASTSSTQRISSRKIRFAEYIRVLGG